jgi:hypothetical protein
LLAPPLVRAAPPAEAGDDAGRDATAELAPQPEFGSEADVNQRIDGAIEAWRQGEWTEVRDLLEPLVRGSNLIEDPLLRESALRYLAEATLLDEGLDLAERTELARDYVVQLLEIDPDWTPPSGLHGRAFYDLVGQVRSERDKADAADCRGELIACQADLQVLEVDHEKLEADYAAQDVAVRDIIKRNRGLALIPLGVGHFTNDNMALGITFLSLEVLTGAAGLSLLLYRVKGLGCVRTDGYASKSLHCPAPSEAEVPALQDRVEKLRKTEEVMGYLFLGSIVLDIVVAQALFKPITVVDRGKMSREQLERETQADPNEPRGGRRSNKPPSAKLEIRPYPAYFPHGVGLGVDLRF